MVQVTNAPEGRTYIDHKWNVRPGAEQYFRPDTSPHALPPFGQWVYRDEDVVEVQTPHIVANGKWVMERPTGWNWLISTTFKELDRLEYTDKHDIRRVLYISDKPFGFITAEEEDVDMTVYPRLIKANGRKTLACARQIHKGELGQSVPIIRLKYVRQAFQPGQKQHMKSRDRKRSNYGWVRLAELAAAAQLTPAGIIFGFWQYSGHRNYWMYDNGQEGGVLLDLVMASSPTDIWHKCPEVQSVTQLQAAGLIRESFEDLWVRRGFAYTVLRLLALGVRPELMQLV